MSMLDDVAATLAVAREKLDAGPLMQMSQQLTEAAGFVYQAGGQDVFAGELSVIQDHITQAHQALFALDARMEQGIAALRAGQPLT